MSRNRRILLFSCEPGGAEVLVPVAELLDRLPGCTTTIAGYGLGAERFRARGLACTPIDPVGPGDTAALEAARPDMVITSATSLPERDMSEKHLWQAARRLGIPSIAFLDQWQNYAVRFSGTTPESRLAYLPDFINCIDGQGERDLVAAGVEPSRLRKFGHPYLSSLADRFGRINRGEVAARIGLRKDDQITLFVSEPIREHYGRSRGYDQFDSLELFFRLIRQTPGPDRVVLKLHPKDDLSVYRPLLSRHADLAPVAVTGELNPFECLKLSTRVYGMTSIMLIEAYVLGLPVVSLQPGLCVEDPLILSRLGQVPLVTGDPAAPTPTGNGAGTIDWTFKTDAFQAFVERLLGVSLTVPPACA
ncbi:MAG: hypothetical protein WCJ64_00250 [Rhodospirillaceae bacterium]